MPELAEDAMCRVCDMRPGRTVYNGKCEECFFGDTAPALLYVRKEKKLTAREAEQLSREDLLFEPVIRLSVPQKIVNTLDRDLDIIFIKDLLEKSKIEILRDAKAFGADSIEKLEKALEEVGLKLRER